MHYHNIAYMGIGGGKGGVTPLKKPKFQAPPCDQKGPPPRARRAPPNRKIRGRRPLPDIGEIG